MLDAIQAFDTAALLFIQDNIRRGVLDSFFKTMSFIGDAGMLWIILAVILLAVAGTRRGGLDLALALIFAAVFCNLILKNLIARPRPYITVEELRVIIEPLGSYSFPSGHACSSFASATALALAFRGRGGAWAFVPASLIALSRIYVGIHYPTDIICGALIGTLTAMGIYYLSHRYIKSDLILKKRQL